MRISGAFKKRIYDRCMVVFLAACRLKTARAAISVSERGQRRAGGKMEGQPPSIGFYCGGDSMSPSGRVALVLLLLIAFSAAAAAQVSLEDAGKIDALVAKAYQAASVKLPCKISTARSSHMMDWKKVDKCMEQARLRVDWDELSSQLKALRHPSVSEGDFASAVEESFARQALPYKAVFKVSDEEALLPLTNSILKNAVQNTLLNRPVFPLKGKLEIGRFSGVYYFERGAAIATGSSYRLALFQYTDPQGHVQSPPDKLLLDSFGIKWFEIEARPGFRFPVELLPGLGR
jgi:hypothetical protein